MHSFPIARVTRSGFDRRAGLIAAVVAVVAAGLLVTQVGRGSVAKDVGDGLYAVLVYLLVALALSQVRAAVLGAIALGLCALIELTQLTGISAAVVDLWQPARYVLGTTFQASDLVAYAAGVVVAAGVDHAWSTGRRAAQ